VPTSFTSTGNFQRFMPAEGRGVTAHNKQQKGARAPGARIAGTEEAKEPG